MSNLVSFFGIFAFMGIAWVLSSNRRKMNWRLIGCGLGLQVAFALFIFYLPVGAVFFKAVNVLVLKVLDAAFAGIKFLFGPLASGEGGFVLAVQSLPTIVFFSALMSILYYCGIMSLVIRGFAYVFTMAMRISGAEAVCAASNIFVGIESSLTVRPYLSKMTKSELCTVLTVGMATVASSVMALYVSFLEKSFPTIAGHLVSASFLSAPAALIMSKIIMPETGEPETLGVSVKPNYEKENSVFEAIINGANAGVRLVVGIAALLLAILGLVALVNIVLGGVGSLCGSSTVWSLEGILGVIYYPFALLMGVDPDEAFMVSKMIGVRTVATEIPAYQMLAGHMAEENISMRSAVISTYALCGFAHVASMAIFVGGVCALVPERTGDVTKAGLRALLAATLACMMTAAVAGAFYTPAVESVLLQ